MKFWLILGIFLLAQAADAQKKEITLDKLIDISLLSEAALPEVLHKKGFLQSAADTAFSFVKAGKDKKPEKTIQLRQSPEAIQLQFGTLNAEEFLQIVQELKQKGFAFVPEKTIAPNVHELYQRGALCIRPQIVQQNEQTWYRLELDGKKFPPPHVFRYMEDLMQLPSHEYLVAVFGPENVNRDVFYFSEKEVSKCSVLFPNTSRQVIVVWKDEQYSRDIALLVVGGETMGSNARQAFFRPVEQGKWQSRQGVFVGMPLRELQEHNEAPVDFYGWESDEPGVVAPTNKGKINFKQVGVQLHCLDCNEDRFYSDSPVLNSTILLQQARRVYVNTVVLKPE